MEAGEEQEGQDKAKGAGKAREKKVRMTYEEREKD